MAVEITLNGQTKALDLPTPTLEKTVLSLGLQLDRVAVEVNGLIIPRSRWQEFRLSQGDKVELVQFVGGGFDVRSRKSLSHRSP